MWFNGNVFLNKFLQQKWILLSSCQVPIKLMGINLNELLARYVGFMCRLHHKMKAYREERDIHCDSKPLRITLQKHMEQGS